MSQAAPSKGRTLSTSLLALTDFGANSLTTLVLAFMAAKALRVGEFGTFGVTTNVALFAQAVVQGGLIDVMMRRANELKPAGFWSVERGYPLAVLVGIAALLPGLYVSPYFLLLTGVGIIFLYVRTFWVRAFLVASGRSTLSASLSGSSLVLALAALGIQVTTHLTGWGPVLLANLVTYGLPSIWVHVLLRRSFRVQQDRTSYWNLAYAMENLVLMGALQMSSVVATPFLGLSFSAGLRGASILMGPLSVVFSGTRLLLLAWLSSRRPSLRDPMMAAVAMALGCVAWAVVCFFLVRDFGAALLGSTAGMARDYLPWVALTYVTQGAYMVLFVSGRAYVADHAVRLGRSTEVLIVVLGTVMAIIFRSPVIYFVCNAISMMVAFMVLATLMHGHLNRPRRAAPSE